VFEKTAQRLALHMVLKVGDIQFVADSESSTARPSCPSSSIKNSPIDSFFSAHVFHARTAYVDYAPPAPRRHLLRLWLATPESEGGWKRPFPDSSHPKRGGIQVNDQEETCPLDAE
jgi:hypothetical protein